MRQTAFAVIIELQAARRQLAADDVARLVALDTAHAPLLAEVQPLHFMSIAIADDPYYNALLIFDVVCDGAPGHLWPAIVHRIGPPLLAILSHTLPRRGTKVTAPPRTTAEIAAYLELHSVYPAALHHGNRGMTRNRILAEAKLAKDAESRVDALLAAPGGRDLGANHLHAALRKAVGHPPAPPPRYNWWEKLVLRLKNQTRALLIAIAVVLAAIGGGIWYGRRLLVAIAQGDVRARAWLGWLDALACWVMPGLVLALLLGLAGLFWQLRRLETTDAIKDSPRLDPVLRARLREIDPGVQDNTVQNHLVAVVHVKPGIARTIILRLALFALKYKILIQNVDGYLQTMRTIHFIQWNMIDNGGRVVFMSNYDGTWDSYLDDFTEKANEGLTAGWSNCIGFPETRNLLRKGAASGDDFKRWTLQWQHPTLFTYRAYPMLTVDQIERNAAIAEGLYADNLSPPEALRWAARL